MAMRLSAENPSILISPRAAVAPEVTFSIIPVSIVESYPVISILPNEAVAPEVTFSTIEVRLSAEKPSI
jgi:hypothetical protein